MTELYRNIYLDGQRIHVPVDAFPASGWGVVPGNDGTANLASLIAAMALISNAGGGTLVFGPGTYAFSDEFFVPNGVSFLGVKGSTRFDFRSVDHFTTNSGFIKAGGTYDSPTLTTHDVKPTPPIPVVLMPTVTTRAGTVVSATTDLPHGLAIGDIIWVLASILPADAGQGVFLTVNSSLTAGRFSARTTPTVVLSAPTATTFSYTVADTGDTVLTLAAARVVPAADIIPLASTAGYAVGDTISVRSEAYRQNGGEQVKLGELHKIARVINSTWLLLHSEVQDQFLVADGAKIAKAHLHEGFSFRGIELIGHGPNPAVPTVGDRGIACYACDNPAVEDCIFTDCDQMGVSFQDCINGRAVGNVIVFNATDEAGEESGDLDVQYGITFGGATIGLLISNNTMFGGRHQIVESSNGGSMSVSADRYGAAKGVTIIGNALHGAWLGSIASHQGCDTLVVSNNVITGTRCGINLRFGRNCIVSNNAITSFDQGITIAQVQSNIKILNNTLRVSGAGIQVAGQVPPIGNSPATNYELWGPISISGNTCIGGSRGIYLRQDTPRGDGQIDIVGNIIKDTKYDAIRIQFGDELVASDGFIGRISGNTLIDIGRITTGAVAISLVNMRGGSVDNNVFHNTGPGILVYGIRFTGEGTGDGTISAMNNLVPPGLVTTETLRVDLPGKQVFSDMPPKALTLVTTILAGGVAKPKVIGRLLVLDTEAAAATDDLDTLNAGSAIGRLVTLRSTSNARAITVKDGTGNIQTGADRVLDSTRDTLTLVWDGTTWNEIAFASN